MKKLISALSLALLSGCASDKGGTTVAGTCTQTAYTNGSRVTCPSFDALEFGAIQGVVEERPCGSQPQIVFLRLDDGSVVDVRSGSIVPQSAGPHVEAGCSFIL